MEIVGPPDVSGGGGESARGREGFREALAEWVDTWDDYEYRLAEVLDFGDHALVTGWQRGRGKGSGVEVSEEIFTAWTLRGGKVIRMQLFRDRSQALAAVSGGGG